MRHFVVYECILSSGVRPSRTSQLEKYEDFGGITYVQHGPSSESPFGKMDYQVWQHDFW